MHIAGREKTKPRSTLEANYTKTTNIEVHITMLETHVVDLVTPVGTSSEDPVKRLASGYIYALKVTLP